MMDLNINDIVELARRATRNGRPAIEDPLTRDELVKLVLEAKGNAAMGSRARIPALGGTYPTAVAMSAKLRSSELKRKMTRFAVSLQPVRLAAPSLCPEKSGPGLCFLPRNFPGWPWNPA